MIVMGGLPSSEEKLRRNEWGKVVKGEEGWRLGGEEGGDVTNKNK